MEKFLPYRDSIPDWAEQANGMLQFAIWTQLEAAGLGASLQHYTPIIDKDVKDAFLIPSEWRLIAQMPFGKILAPAGDTEFGKIDDRLKIFK